MIAPEESERRYGLAHAAQLKYGAIPELEDHFAKMEAADGGDGEERMVVEVVGPDQIAEVVARWTGIPVTRLGQDNKQRLMGLGERLRQRVMRLEEAVPAVAEAVSRHS